VLFSPQHSPPESVTSGDKMSKEGTDEKIKERKE
jgi:hypothetical protein